MLVDGGSVNGTYVRRGEELERIGRRAALRDGDVVCILAAVETDGARRYFELAYRQVADAQRTRAAPVSKIRDVADASSTRRTRLDCCSSRALHATRSISDRRGISSSVT